MELVERDRELAELTQLLAESAQGAGSAALISGGIGCGKSELLDAVKAHAAEAGFLVLAAVGSWAERRSPGSVLGQLLRYADVPAGPESVGGPADGPGNGPADGNPASASPSGGIGELLECLHRAHPTPEPATDADPGTFDAATTAALHRLCTEVLRRAGQVPILLCIDDVQFTDALSLHWLRQLLRRLRGARIALVATECTLSRPTDPRLHAELLRQPHYRRITVGKLTLAGVQTLLTRHLDAGTAQALASACHAVTAGNPLLVRALVEDHRNAAVAPEPAAPELVVADAYGDAVLSCLLRDRPVLMRLAQALAVLDADADVPDILPRMLEDDEAATVDRGLHALETAGLLDGRRLRHPVARAAVLASIAPHRRSAMHRRAAELLYAEGAAATRVSRHLLAAERGPQRWAVTVLREAAERHLAANRPADAHACVDAALRLCDDDGQRMGLKALLASTAWVLNPSISARHLGELTVALREGRLPDRYAVMLAKYLLWHGRGDEAAEAIGRIGDRESETDPASLAEARATRELLYSSYPGLLAGGAQRSPRSSSPETEVSALLAGGAQRIPRSGSPDPRTPAPLAERPTASTDPRIRGAAALSYVLMHGPDDGAVADAEASMRTMRLGKKTHEWIMCAAASLEFADRLDAARSWCDHWLEEARARQVPLWEAEFASLRARIALRQGDPRLARKLAEAALAQVPVESWGVCIGGPLANLVQAATDTGDYEAAAEYLEVPVPDGLFHSRFGLYYLHARGYYHLETGRPYAALDDFTTCGELMRKWGFDQPSLVPWRTEAARAHLMLGDAQRAQALAREQLAMIRGERSRARGISLRVLAAASPPVERTTLLAEAVEILQASGDRLQLAGALADLGRAHQRAGRPARARPVVEMAAKLAESCGAVPLLRKLAVDTDALAWVRPAGAASADRAAAISQLSMAERRVAALAARGHTNREISKKLSVTVSTVEQHLTRVFRKLGVKARKDLPERIVLEAMAQ